MRHVVKPGFGLRHALRCSVAAAAFVLLAGAASAQALEVAVEVSPAGLDPHSVTAFASSPIVLGPIYEGLTPVGNGHEREFAEARQRFLHYEKPVIPARRQG